MKGKGEDISIVFTVNDGNGIDRSNDILAIVF